MTGTIWSDLVGADWSTHSMARPLDLNTRTDDITRAICGLLPQDDYDLWDARAWLAWCEIGRHAEGPAVAVARADEHEVWLLQEELGDREAGVAAHALLRGLRESVAALGEHAMPLDVAQRIWAAHLASVPPPSFRRGAGGPEAA